MRLATSKHRVGVIEETRCDAARCPGGGALTTEHTVHRADTCYKRVTDGHTETRYYWVEKIDGQAHAVTTADLHQPAQPTDAEAAKVIGSSVLIAQARALLAEQDDLAKIGLTTGTRVDQITAAIVRLRVLIGLA